MKRLLAISVALLALLVAIAAVLAVAAPRLIATSYARRAVTSIATAASGYRVGVGEISSGAGGALLFSDVEVRDHGGAERFRAERVSVTLTWSSVLSGVADAVVVEGFRVRLPEGESTGRSTSPRLPLRRLDLERGVVLVAGEREVGLRVGSASLSADAASGYRSSGRAQLLGTDGSVEWQGSANPGEDRLDVRLEFVVDDAAEALAVFGGAEDVTQLAGVRLSGRVDVAGVLGEDLAVDYAVLGEGGGLPTAVDLRGSGATDDGVLELRSTLAAGPGTGPLSISGTLDAGAGWRDAKLDVALAWEAVKLAKIVGLYPTPTTREIVAGELDLTARIVGTPADPRVEGRLAVDGLKLAGDDLEAEASIELPFAYEAGALQSVEPGLRLSALAVAYGESEGSADEVQAALSIAIAGVAGSTGGTSIRLRDVRIGGVGFHDGDYRRIAEAVELEGRALLSRSAAGVSTVEVSLASSKGELLWDRLYLSLDEQPVEVDLAVDLPDADAHTVVRRARVHAPKLFDATARATLDRARRPLTLELDFAVPSLEPAFEVLVKESLSVTYPRLERTRVGGALRGELRGRFAEGRFVSLGGRMGLEGGMFEVVRAGEGRDTKLRGIRLDLPLLVGASAGNETATGSFSLAPSELVGVSLPGFSLALRVRPDRIESVGDVAVEVAGGSVSLERLRIESLSTERRAARFGLTFDGLDLAPLLAAAGLPAFEGTLGGALPRVEASRSAIVSEGGVHVGVFGGQVVASDLRVEQLSTPVPSLHLDLAMRDIDLRQVTAATALGEIGGSVGGAIDDLEIVAGQPVSFDAWLETAGGRRSKQKISVKALEQLQILGGGGEGPLARGLLGFFDEYRYAKMGLRCSLRRDLFVLKGVEELDGKDFLVVGSFWPPTVNVISHNHEIVFSEMVARLSRIAAVGEAEGGNASEQGEPYR